jgi:hypothetical protein
MIGQKHNLVYKTTNLINGNIYIGVHCTDKIDDGYLGSGIILKNAINIYGRENFKRDIIYDVDTSELAYFIESFLVDSSFCKREDTYNIKKGGEGGTTEKLSIEHRKNISKGLMGHKVSESARKKLSIFHKGIKKSKQHRIALKEAKCKSKVLCINTGIIYNSLAEAQEDTNICKANIWSNIKGFRLHAGKLSDGTKLSWKYV